MRIAEALGEPGADFLRWARKGLIAYARWAYDPASNTCFSVITDGTRLTPEDVKREGYYGAGMLATRPAGGPLLLAYALAARLAGDDFLWQTARSIARGNDLGDIGARPGEGASINRETSHGEATSLLALLGIWRGTGAKLYLELAEVIGDNLIRRTSGMGSSCRATRPSTRASDALKPLALLSLEAALRGQPDLVPAYTGGTANLDFRKTGWGGARERPHLRAEAMNQGDVVNGVGLVPRAHDRTLMGRFRVRSRRFMGSSLLVLSVSAATAAVPRHRRQAGRDRRHRGQAGAGHPIRRPGTGRACPEGQRRGADGHDGELGSRTGAVSHLRG